VSELLLLHGYSGHADDWAHVQQRLPAKAAHAEPILGHRGQPEIESRSTTFEDEVDRLARRVGEMGLSAVHIAGYSLGARIALGLLVRHPSLVTRATLIGVRPGLATEAERSARRRSDRAWIELLRHEGIARFADAWESQPLLVPVSEVPAEVIGSTRERRRRHHPEGLALAMEVLGLGAMPDYWPALSTVRIPVTLVHGERDPGFGVIAGEMAAQMESARVRRVPHAGHNVVLESPHAIAEILLT
jgi:2-succinyl-6-hydroxy-2,4-cyclohexadiene-1-carboxylate synthase